MRLPSKVTPYERSALPQMVFVMKRLDRVSMRPRELYSEWMAQGLPACDFMGVMDALFAIGSIELDDEGRLMVNVERN